MRWLLNACLVMKLSLFQAMGKRNLRKEVANSDTLLDVDIHFFVK